jgi:hypothetical protein
VTAASQWKASSGQPTGALPPSGRRPPSQIRTSLSTGPREDENIGALLGEYMHQPPSAVLAKTREMAAAPTMRAVATAILTLTFRAWFMPR